MKRSDRLLYLAFRCLCLANPVYNPQARVNHFADRANRLCVAAGEARAQEGGAA